MLISVLIILIYEKIFTNQEYDKKKTNKISLSCFPSFRFCNTFLKKTLREKFAHNSFNHRFRL